MTVTITFAATLGAALGSGIVAGIFFAFSTFMMTALGRLPPEQGMAAMRSINVVIINPWFFSVFFGTAVLALVLAMLAMFNWDDPGPRFVMAGAVLYLICAIVVTIAVNVPMNDALAAVDPASAAGAELWNRYLSAWTAWNHVRTAGSLAAAAAFILALR